MHRYDKQTAALGEAVLDYALRRLQLDPVPLDGPKTVEELDTDPRACRSARRASAARRPSTCSPGAGARPASRSTTRATCPSSPARPTEASSLFDLVVGASALYGGSWLEGAGAVYAENAALRWVADLAGLPETAGGVFVPGGTVGNLSALVAARHAAKTAALGRPAAALEGRRHLADALLDQERLRCHGRRLHRRAGRRATAG